jgi:hypothetical protein
VRVALYGSQRIREHVPNLVDGGRESARQLRDVVEILRVNAGRLDEGYLDQWAEPLAIADELRHARDRAAKAR